MALLNSDTFQSSSNLSLWFKVYTGDSLNLADIPEIIPLRWVYFRDNWQLIKQKLINNANNAFDPDYFIAVINDLTDFIARQRSDSTDINPFSASSIYYRFYPVFDSIRLESISLTNEERTIISNKKLVVNAYSKTDFLNMKSNIRAYRDYLADVVGLSDPDYNVVYGRSSVAVQTTPSITDINLMKVLEDQLKTVDFILSNLFAVDTALDPFALAKQNANNPDVDIRQYASGKLVKLNFGEDLPSLAQRYFGSADRWVDIAIANGLKEPYVDEIGQQLFLLTNGNGNQINIASSDTQGNPNITKFFINQYVLIQSIAYPYPTQRIITGIKQIPVSGEIVLAVNGDATMSQYLLSDNASIRIFKPNTINSSQYILIPSPNPLPSNRVEDIPWFLASSSADEKGMKVDIAIGPNGELLHTSTGDISLSYSLDNAIQAVRAKVQTELGSNRRHQNFGIINLNGIPTSDADQAKTALVQSIVGQIQADSRFDRVESISVDRSTTSKAVAYDVTLVVKLAGSDAFVPITFTVNT